MKPKTSLIVTGVARSGTTALAALLNAHPEICVGIERYKFRYLKLADFSDGLFARERFFDFRAEDTNLIPANRPAWAGTYDDIARKWDRAKVLGDKVPDLLPILGDMLLSRPDWRCICILRNLKDVGLSWQKRADKPRDAWPASKNFAAACISWLTQMQDLQQLFEDLPELHGRILLLDYDRMYDPGLPVEAAILNFLGLGPSPEFSAMLAGHRGFTAARQGHESPLCEAHARYARLVDTGILDGLCRQAARQLQDWAGRGPVLAAPLQPAGRA